MAPRSMPTAPTPPTRTPPPHVPDAVSDSALSDYSDGAEATSRPGSNESPRQSISASSRAPTPHLSGTAEPNMNRVVILDGEVFDVEQSYVEQAYPWADQSSVPDEDGQEESSISSADSTSSEVIQRSEGTQRVIDADIEDMKSSIAGLELYPLVDKIGEGTFSSVYKAIDLYHDYYDNTIWTNKEPHPPRQHARKKGKGVYVALKRIYVTSSPDRILNELAIMEDLRGRRNIAYLVTAFRTEDQIIVVMPYTRHVDFRRYYREIDIHGIRQYMKCLFTALAQVHSLSIIHRDVKPANFLYDPRNGEGTLCDFGLAERFEPSDWKGRCHHTCPTAEQPRGTVAINLDTWSIHTQPGGELGPKVSKNAMGPPKRVERVGFPKDEKRGGVRANRAGTRGFRAPEVLLKCQDQTPAVDVWSAGIILLAFLTKRFPIFNANTDVEALLELTVIFGKSKIGRCALLHNRTFHCTVPLERPEGFKVFDLILKLNPDIMTPLPHTPDEGYLDEYVEDVQMAMDLCRVCLHVDVTRRWTAEECLEHPFLRLDELS